MKDGVVRRHEILKKNIHTILDNFPIYSQNLPSEDNEMLMEFISVLQHLEEVEYQRDKLSARLDEYVAQKIGTDQYLQTPFLWYSLDFCINAKLILSVAKFHAEEFFSYVLNNLRKTFKLIREGTSFHSEAFESLQYECNRLQVPLSHEQLQALQVIYSDIRSLGYLALNSQRIERVVNRQVSSLEYPKDFTSFLRLLDGKFFLLLNHRAFDLEYLYVHFYLGENVALKEVIDFHNPKNTVLCSSDVFTIRESPNNYLGLLVSPVQYTHQLKAYFHKCHHQKKLTLYEITPITKRQRTTSLTLYSPNKGWNNLSLTQSQQLTQQLKTNGIRKSRVESHPFFITPQFKPIWHYQVHDHPSKIIKFYCRVPREFTVDELPLNPTNQKSHLKFSREEFEIYKILYRNHVCFIGFRSDRLWYEWALDDYWVKLNPLPLKQLAFLLQWLPVCEIWYAEKNLFLATRLPRKWVDLMQNDLNWTIYPKTRTHYPLQLKYEWFNPETLQWVFPAVFK